MSVRVLFTGSRNWQSISPIKAVIDSLPPDAVVIHGACRTGADAIVDRLAKARGLKVDPYPADWTTHGKAAGPIRNRRMVAESKPTEAHAYPMFDSKGTWDCVNALKDAGVPTTIDRRAIR